MLKGTTIGKKFDNDNTGKVPQKPMKERMVTYNLHVKNASGAS